MRSKMLILVFCLLVIAIILGLIICRMLESNNIQNNTNSEIATKDQQVDELDETEKTASTTISESEKTDPPETSEANSEKEATCEAGMEETIEEGENDLPMVVPEDQTPPPETVNSIAQPIEPENADGTKEDDRIVSPNESEEIGGSNGDDLPFVGA